jgi:hypothetical protein
MSSRSCPIARFSVSDVESTAVVLVVSIHLKKKNISFCQWMITSFAKAIENLVRTHISTPVRPLVTHNSLHLLWPQPQRIVELEGPPFVPQKELQISIIQSPVSIHRYHMNKMHYAC